MKKVFKRFLVGGNLKRNSDGFTSVECVVSLSIIGILVYMISISLYNNYFILNQNIQKIEMPNILKSNLDYIKNDIRQGNIIANYKSNEIINAYEVIKVVEKDKNYYNCYRIVVEIKNDKQTRRIEGYVLQ